MGGDDGAVDLALASLAADAAERDHLDAGAVDDERAVRRGRGRATVSGKRRTHVVGARPGDEQAVLVAKHDGVECGVALAGSELERERGPETRRAMLAAIHFHRQIVPNPRGETNFLAVPLIQPPQAGAQPIGSRLQAHRRTVAVTFRRARSLPGMSARALVPIALAVVVSCTTPPGAIIDASSLDASAVDAGIELASVTVHVRTERGDGAADPTATVFLVDPDGQLAVGIDQEHRRRRVRRAIAALGAHVHGDRSQLDARVDRRGVEAGGIDDRARRRGAGDHHGEGDRDERACGHTG